MTSSYKRVLLISAAVVLVFDTVAAGASAALGFPYTAATVGSWLIYAAAAFFGARAGGGVWMGVLAAAMTGLVDSTAGWLISSAIGPGRPVGAAASPGAIAATVVTVTVLAGAVGIPGAVLGRLTGRRPADRFG
jgi:hypothetical protein